MDVMDITDDPERPGDDPERPGETRRRAGDEPVSLGVTSRALPSFFYKSSAAGCPKKARPPG
ncbi:hypothetical protein EYF80_055903 [Liparis tanakae]|uniref:Uncharacterized protein n=1 Tax=Liparis tanakae TaxID=230148 RepID=A0A4Z2EZW7_9TELE|nr:hypothetical protein EYF80_055903 [Liparis tanakae]